MIVSLEAIFLSTFVMISQNRADAKRQVVADQQWQTVKEEDKQNEQLLDLSNQILELTKAVHAYAPGPIKRRRVAAGSTSRPTRPRCALHEQQASGAGVEPTEPWVTRPHRF